MSNKGNGMETLLRQWAILKNIPQSPKKTTATDLMRRLENEGFYVSKRTIERNLLTLSEIFPLYADDRSRPYGWSWQKDASMFSVPGMSPLQALTLTMAHDHLRNPLPASLMGVLGPYFRYADNILLSGDSVKSMADWRDKVTLISASQPLISPDYDDVILETVHDALLSERQLEISYQSRSKRKKQDCTVHPLGLVQRGNIMYLIVTVSDYTDVRLLALHRIRSAQKLNVKANKPKGFCLADFVKSGALGFFDKGKIRLVAMFSKTAAEHLYETPLSKDQKLTEEGERIRVEATVSDTSQLKWWLMAFGADVEVLEPASLRNVFVKTAEEMASYYLNPSR